MYNAHADITRMVDENGELAEKYYYDEWGVETETLKYGDVNCDGEVDLSDYSSLKSFILQETEKLTKEQQIVSDVNGDGTVNMTDANLLKFSVLHPESVNFPADTNKDGFINEKNNIKYAGYIYDGETGLYYLNARFYDPETARFIQQDSYSGNILDPLSLNLYTYGHNNPISYYDPTGHSIKSIFKSVANTVKKAVKTVKTAVTVAKPVVKETAKAAATVAVNTTVKKATTPIANTIKAAANKTENQRSAFQTALAVGKLVQSPVVNAWANYAQGEYDTLAGQIDGFMQFSYNPAQTIGNSVNYFLSDPLRNNPVADVAGYYKDVAIASYNHDWNTISYKLGVGAVNLTEFYVGGKIASKMPEIKASATNVSNNIVRKLYDTKSSALSKIGNYADDFRIPSPALAGGIDTSALSIKSEITSNAGGVRAGTEKSIYYSSKGARKSSLDSSSSIIHIDGSPKKIDYKKVFFDEYPDLKGKVVVHHAVEQQVLRKPQTQGLFSEAEIHSIDNLRGIPNEANSDLHLSKIRKEWNRFYKEYPNPTKDDLLSKKAEIDNKYGHLFNPPIK